MNPLVLIAPHGEEGLASAAAGFHTAGLGSLLSKLLEFNNLANEPQVRVEQCKLDSRYIMFAFMVFDRAIYSECERS